MAELFFNVYSDWQEVEKLRNECSRLEAQLRATNAQTDPRYQKQLEDQLKSTRQQMDEMVSAAARAGTVMSKDFTRKIADVEAETKRLARSVDVTKQQYRELASMRGALEGKRRNTARGSSEYRSLTRDINDLTATMTDLQTRRNELDKQYKHSENVLKGLNEQRVLYASGLVKAGSAANEATAALGGISRSSSRAAVAMTDLGMTAGQKLPSAFGLFNNSVGMLNENLITLSAGLLGGFGFAQFMNTIISTRGQFQQTEMAFETMLGSAEKASALTGELIDTAAKTPYDFGQVTGAAKQLLAYGTAANEVNDILKRLGDISAGVGSSLGELAYLYGTTMTQGRMYTMDLRQFMGRGIPMAEALAKVMDTTTAKVGKLVTDGKVGAEQVKAAIIEMTKEGSKFGGMMERQSASFTGRLSNIGDSISQMFNELGKRLEPTIGKGLELTGAMVENWETIGKYILTACAALGTYKAGLLATAAIRNAQERASLSVTNNEFTSQIKELERMKRDAQATFANMRGGRDAYRKETMAGINESLTDTTQDDTMLRTRLAIAKQNGIINDELEREILNKRQLIELATEETRLAQLNVERQKRANLDNELTAAENKWSAAQNAFDDAKAAKENTEALIAESEAHITSMQSKLQNASATEKLSLATDIQAEYDRQETLQTQLSTDELRLNAAQQNLDAAATERNTLQTRLNTTDKNINTLSTRGNTLATTTNAGAVNTMTLAERINSISTKAAAVAQTIFSAAVMEATTALHAMKAALLSNPITAIATVAMTAVTAFSMFNDEVDESAEMSTKFGEAAGKATSRVNALMNVIRSTDTTSKVHKDTIKELSDVCKEYGITLDAQKTSLEEVEKAHRAVTEAIKTEAVERQRANAIQTVIDTKDKDIQSAYDEFLDGIDKNKKNVVEYQIKTLIPEGDLVKLQELGERMNAAMRVGGALARNAKKDYFDLLNGMTEKIKTVEQTSDVSFGNVGSKLQTLSRSTAEANDTMNKSIDIINDTAAATTNWNDKTTQAAYVAKHAKDKVDDVVESARKLSKELSKKYNIEIAMSFKAENVPDWIRNMNIKQLKEFINRSKASIMDMQQYEQKNKGKKRVYKTQHGVMDSTSAAMYMNMAAQIATEKEEARKKKERDEANKKDKKSNSFDPEKAKSDVEKAKERIKEINKKAQEDIDKALIDNMEDGKEKELAKMKQSHEEKIKAIGKQKKEMVDAWVSLAKAEHAQKNKGKTKGFNESAERKKIEENFKTDPKYREQNTILNKLGDEENKRYGKELLEYEKKEIDKYYQYLKEFGTQRQKQSSALQEYDAKIANAEGYDKKILEAQKAQEMEKIKIEGIKQSIDWELVFGEVADLMKDELGQTYRDLREYTQSGDFKTNTSAEDKKTVFEALDKLSAYDPDNKASLDFAQYKKDFEDLGAKIREASRLREEENAAWLGVETAQNRYNNALTSGSEKQKEAAALELDLAKKNAERASELYTTAQDAVNEASENLKRKTETTVTALNNLANGLSGLKSGSLQGAWNGLESLQKGLAGGALGKVGENAADAVAGAFKNTKIISAILGILDILKEGIGTLVSGLLDMVFSAINGLLKNILTGEFVTQIVGSIGKGVGNILNTISFGGFNSLFGIGGNEKYVAETTERLTKENERLRNSVEKLTENISEKYGVSAIQEAELAEEAYKRMEENQRKILEVQMEYWNAHHSNAYYWETGLFGGMDGEGTKLNSQINALIKRYNEINGTNIGNVSTLQDVISLSPDMLDFIRTQDALLWAQMLDVGKYDKSEYWDALADLAGKQKEIEDALSQSLTQTTFEDMQNSFFDALMNMETDAEDWADNISKIMAEALIKNNIFDQAFQDNLNDWMKRYKAVMASYKDGNITQKQLEEELAALREEQAALLAQKKEEAQMYMDAVGYDPNQTDEQSATAQGASSITYDQANNLEGIATAQQITSEQTKNEVTMLNAKVDTLVPVWTDTRNIVADSRDILARMAMDVADIKDNVADSLVPAIKNINDELTKIRKKVEIN